MRVIFKHHVVDSTVGQGGIRFLRGTVARAHGTMVHPAMEDRAEASAPAKMDMGIVDHRMVGHDMSDPAMARAMEAGMRNRFFVSLLITIPVILYSPLGTSLFKLHLPTPFDISPNWVLCNGCTSLLLLERQIRSSLSAFMSSFANSVGEDMKPRCPPAKSTISRPNCLAGTLFGSARSGDAPVHQRRI